MKKILLIVVLTLLLTSCNTENWFKDPCDGFIRTTWIGTSMEGSVSYHLPTCWRTFELPDGTFNLQNEDNTARVVFQTTPPENGEIIGTYALYTGKNLYVTASNLEDPETEDILNSIKILAFAVSATSCEAPDYDYAQSVNYTWQGITFALPFCWGAEESHTLGGDAQLMLYRQDGNGTYTRVNFWTKDPLNDHYVKKENSTLSGMDAERYVYEKVEGTTDISTIFVLSSTPVWYIETNSPEDNNVQLILTSLQIQPILIPTP